MKNGRSRTWSSGRFSLSALVVKREKVLVAPRSCSLQRPLSACHMVHGITPFLPDFSDSIKVASTQKNELAVKRYTVTTSCYNTTYGNCEDPPSEFVRIEEIRDAWPWARSSNGIKHASLWEK